MPSSLPMLVVVGFWLFAVGTVVGSFVNVCVYRIPWQKSVIWPASHCPKCFTAIAARDNIPVVGWLALGGRCRTCSDRISVRYPLIEALVGLLFVGVFLADVVEGPRPNWRGEIPVTSLGIWFYHAILVALLVAGSFIDYDLTIIPDEITVTGMLLGLSLGAAFPWVRPDPLTVSSNWAGFWIGVNGLIIGGGLTWSFRTVFSFILRREAMGFGDVTLMAMIGAFLGWKAAVLTFFLAPFFGIAHALWKLSKFVGKRLRGVQSSSADRELPFGPYLSMAAVALVISWPWLWPMWAKDFFDQIRMLSLWMLGL